MQHQEIADSLPPVAREQAFLETYFQCISQFSYDKAKELAEKERDGHKHMGLWPTMLGALVQLALAEKSYTSLLFLGQRWYTRKADNLRTTYGLLLSELKKMEEAKSGDPSLESGVEKLLGHLCGQLCHFLAARSKTMDFYEQMSAMGTHRTVNYEDLQIVILDIIQAHQKNFHHPILCPLRTSYSYECDIISHLVKAQLQLQNWQFLMALLHLNDAHSKLTSWTAVLPIKETKKMGFGSSSKNPPVPALYAWLGKWKALLVAKFSLYFHETLSKQAPPGEVNKLAAKCTVDFVGKAVTFQKKSDATCVSLVLDATGLGSMHKGPGYQHPKKFLEPPKGLDSYPAIFSCPVDFPERHLPSVISIMNDRSAELNTFEKVVYFCDEKLVCTYFLSRIEPRITLAIIFESKKLEKDSYINNFITDFCSQIRCNKLFTALKPGVK